MKVNNCKQINSYINIRYIVRNNKDRQKDIYIERKIYRQIERYIDRQKDIYTRQIERYIDRQKDT